MNFERMIDGIEAAAAETNKQEQGDYVGADGLLYCGKCNTPKQVRVTLFGQERTPHCMCKCRKEEYEQEKAEDERQRREQRIKDLRRMGFADSELEHWTFDKDDGKNEKVTTVAKNYCTNFREMKAAGKGLLFYGTVGTGKTFISACIANALIDKGYACMVTNFARLTNTISGMFDGKQEYIDRLNRFDLLIIDDLAAERDTEYMNEIVQMIVDNRYRSGLPLIITTNLTAEEIKNPADIKKQRTYSRLLEMCIPIHVEGADRRKEKLKEDYNDFKDLLGL